jgi:translation initiation factor IF-2
MSDTKTGDDKTLSVSTKKTLTLKRPGSEQGTVRQNFSHGRTNTVVVETKKRKFTRGDERPETPAVTLKPRVTTPAAPSTVAPRPARPRLGRCRRHGAARTVLRRDRRPPPRAGGCQVARG